MVCVGLLGLVLWCEPPKPVAVDSFCRVARIIRPSRKDTDMTKRQILAHNMKVRRLCKRKEKK